MSDIGAGKEDREDLPMIATTRLLPTDNDNDDNDDEVNELASRRIITVSTLTLAPFLTPFYLRSQPINPPPPVFNPSLQTPGAGPSGMRHHSNTVRSYPSFHTNSIDVLARPQPALVAPSSSSHLLPSSLTPSIAVTHSTSQITRPLHL